MTAQMVLTIGSDALTLLLMIAMPVLGVVMAMGFDAQAGVDLHLSREARKAGKSLMALETLQDQIDMFEAQPRAVDGDLQGEPDL